MYRLKTTEIEPGRVLELGLLAGGETVSAADAIEAWRDDIAFRTLFNQFLAECPFEAAFFEMPPMTRVTIDRPFRFVLADAPSLARMRENPKPFSDRFIADAEDDIHVFANLGHDAVLVAPAPGCEGTDFTHLLSFVRTAPAAQRDALWRHTALALEARLSDRPVWVSTSGLGVAWLHLRLDDRPKYYTYKPYAQYRSR